MIVNSALAMSDIECYRRYARDLTRYATSLVGPDEAADVVSDAVLAAFSTTKWPSVEHRRAYLYTAVYHRALEIQRSSRRRARREAIAAGGRSFRSAETSESLDAFRALSALSAQQRAVTYLTYWEDQTPADIADLLEVSEGTVRKQLARARERLRKVLS